jgi:hypothetical protein
MRSCYRFQAGMESIEPSSDLGSMNARASLIICTTQRFRGKMRRFETVIKRRSSLRRASGRRLYEDTEYEHTNSADYHHHSDSDPVSAHSGANDSKGQEEDGGPY